MEKDENLRNSVKVYIAGPISCSPLKNTVIAMEIFTLLLKRGYTPFIPHLYTFLNLHVDISYARLIELDAEWLLNCDAVLNISDMCGSCSTSRGVAGEVALAKAKNIPVYDHLWQLLRCMPMRYEKDLNDDSLFGCCDVSTIDHLTNYLRQKSNEI